MKAILIAILAFGLLVGCESDEEFAYGETTPVSQNYVMLTDRGNSRGNIINCEATNYKYEEPHPTWQEPVVLVVFNFFDDVRELRDAYIRNFPTSPVDPQKLCGFAIPAAVENPAGGDPMLMCAVFVMRPRLNADPVRDIVLAHEIKHCVWGFYHDG